MKLFIRKLFGCLIIVSTIFMILLYLVKPKWNVGQEVQKCIDLINCTDNFENIDTLRLGDSVGKNLIGTNRNNNTLNLGSNQAISILGQLLLFNKFNLSQKKVDSRIVFEGYIKPESFFNNLDQKWTFNYFIKFFYNKNWFFNEDIMGKLSQNNIDILFLDKYPKKNLIRRTYWNGFSLFTYPKFGNSSIVRNSMHLNLIEKIDTIDLNNFKESMAFKSMPVSRRFYKQEKIAYLKLKSLGFNIESPFMINDSFFIEDGVHLKPEFRNFEFYKKLLDLKMCK